MAIEVGETLPNAKLKQMTAEGIKEVALGDIVAGKKVILFGLPGAYTPVCSTSHLPGFVAEAEKLKAEGTATIACISVNDPFVMGAWGDQHGAEGKVLMLCDTDASFTTSLGLHLDLGQFGCGMRSQRYSMVVEDGIVTTLNIEASIFDHGSSAAASLLASAAA